MRSKSTQMSCCCAFHTQPQLDQPVPLLLRENVRPFRLSGKVCVDETVEAEARVLVPISKRRTTMTTKGKVLVLVSSGHGLPLKDGKVYTGAGYYLNELTVPVRALMKEGYEITFANPKGNTPQMDVHSAVPDFFGGDEAKLQDYMIFGDGLTGLRD